MTGAWLAWMAAVSVQALVLLALVLAADLLLRRAWPQLRAVPWIALLLKLALPPTLASPLSLAHAVPESVSSRLAPIPAPEGEWLAPLLAAWALGAAALLAALAVGHSRVRRRWIAEAREAPAATAALAREWAERIGLRRAPAVLVHASLGPALVGVVRPVIVVPESLRGEELSHALLHELVHARRRDPLAALACALLRAAWWFHPAAWIACSRLADLREMCCDHDVARVLGEEAPSYRRTLARLALRPAGAAGAALGIVHRHSRILARIEALERPFAPGSRLRRAATAAAAVMLLACAVPLMPRLPVRLMGIEVPPPDRLEGCLARRYVVHGLIAAEAAAADPASRKP